MSVERIRQIAATIPVGCWTTYQDVGELVYGHRNGMQAVGDLLGRAGDVEGAHRILRAGGHISEAFRRSDGGPETAMRLLREEGSWDDRLRRARSDCYVDAAWLTAHRQ